MATLISLNRTIKNADKTNSAVYSITLKDDDNPTSAFATDSRQEIKNAKGNTFELHVHAVRKPKKVDEEKEADKEFLESCYFLDSDDPKVKGNAEEAVGEELDPWEKAQRIEGWVHRKMKINSSTAFCTAGQVAEHLEGDCRQHAVLAAAMCRAVGVPSRTAVGLVYVDRDKGPVMGFHMWTEVWVKGQWVAIDPTFGHNSIGATHLKIADASWHATQSLVPLFPVARVLGKLSIEIVTVDGK
jgi:transglutaminase-like putative cysteine protease